jgi:hypothetical protein
MMKDPDKIRKHFFILLPHKDRNRLGKKGEIHITRYHTKKGIKQT